MNSGEDEITWLVRRHRQLSGVKAEIETEQAQIVARINDLVEVGWSAIIDDIPASKRKGRRVFSLVAAVGALTPEERDSCKEHSFNPDKVRALIEEKGLLESCMEDAGRAPSVVLR